MWAEARKQERKIRGMLVDYRKRAERRQDFYEKIKADPTQFMQIHGRRCKIHLDPAVAAAGESPAIMMPWQGHTDNLIDRFDVRAHLDYIPPVTKLEPDEPSQEERQCNYESFRILAQNDFLGISEDKFLHQLHLEEQFGVNAQQLEFEKAKKKSNTTNSSGGAAIGYTYDQDDAPEQNSSGFNSAGIIASAAGGNAAQDESDSDIDVDVSIDINKIDTQQAHELNGCGRQYGMQSNDFYSFLTKDADEAESLRMAREEEQEKIMLCGRKSRRERRAQREKRFAGRQTISPPSYAAKEESVKPDTEDKNDSDSRSPTPENSGKITYITSFGGEEDELTAHSKISINFNKAAKGTLGSELVANRLANAAKIASGEALSYADKVKQNLEKLKHLNDNPKSPRKPLAYQRRGHSKSRSRSPSKSSYHRNYRSTQSSRSRYRRSRSNSSSRRRHRRDRTYHRSRSRSRSRDRHRRRYSTSSSSSNSSSSRRRSRRHRSLSSSSSSSSSSSRSSSSSTKTPLPRTVITKARSRSLEREKPILDSKIQTKELETPVRIIEKSTPSNQKATIIAPVNPTPTEIPPTAPSVIKEEPKLPEVQIPIKKYYGRKRDSQSSSSEAELSYEEPESTGKSKTDSTSSTVKNINLGKAAIIQTKDSSSSGTASRPTLNPRDRLKKKMQILLNKQYKADKMAEIEKNERQIQQQQERDDEMREMALRLRRRQRELRHKYGSPGGDSDKSDGSVASSSHSSANNRVESHQKSRHRSRSRSNRSRSKSYESRRRERAKHSHRRHSRDSPRHRRSRERSKRRSTSRDYRRRSKSTERRRNNDRPRKLVDY